MKLLIFLHIFLIIQTGNPNLNQDIIYPKASEVKLENGETCEVISEKKMLKAKNIFHSYWSKNISDSTWAKFNRQYITYNSNQLGSVVYINGVCLEKPAEFFKKIWCIGMAKDKCYYTAFIDLKKKNVIFFKWNTYDK